MAAGTRHTFGVALLINGCRDFNVTNQVVRVQKHQTEEASETIKKHGVVIVEQAISAAPLRSLRERMDRDTEELLAYCDSIGGNPRERGHLQQGPPLSREFMFEEVAMNPYVIDICASLFDSRPNLTFYNGNTNCPGSGEQTLHMDGQHRVHPPEPAEMPFSVVINIPPGPMNVANGAIELWPGSHLDRPWKRARLISGEQQNERRKVAPPLQPTTEVGDVLIRDVRLWHRGVPNPSNRPRHMIALIYSNDPMPFTHRLSFEKGCEHVLEGHAANANAQYVDDVSDYLLGPTRRIYEFNESKKAERAKQN